MKTRAVRMYGKSDLRLEEFELPPIREDEILVKIVSDSLCMSSYKAAMQGSDHKRVPSNIATNPVILGHEFCGDIVEVGKKWQNQFAPGQRFAIQPALNYQGKLDAPGYSFEFLGGNATYAIMPHEVMDMGCLLPFNGDAYFHGSLGEPISCIVGAYHASYHIPPGSYTHDMGIRRGGKMAILAGAGPMGLGAIDYALHNDLRPSVLVVTDLDAVKLARAESLYTKEEAKRCGVEIHYVNTSGMTDVVASLTALTNGDGFDDILVCAPVDSVLEQADLLLGRDGCLNLFAGPTSPDFTAKLNYYRVHYAGTHVAGVSGGNADDLKESLEMIRQGRLNPSVMITHVGGLDTAIETTLSLPKIPGGKKLLYTHISMPLTAIDDFAAKGKTDPLFARLAEICSANGNMWCAEAERFLLASAPAK
ncbi:MAG: zinc-binding dehydrogenase [Thermoguttaceae bacterium]